MRKKIIAGNWKMNYAPEKAVVFAKSLIDGGVLDGGAEVVFCVPAVDIGVVADAVKGSGAGVGAPAYYFHYITSLAFLGGSGPLWFTFTLLIFTLVYAVFRKFAGLRPKADEKDFWKFGNLDSNFNISI